MSTTDQIAFGALLVAFLSLLTSVVAIVMSVRTSYQTTRQLIFPRMKVTLTQEQHPDWIASATMFTATVENISTTTRILNPSVSIYADTNAVIYIAMETGQPASRIRRFSPSEERVTPEAAAKRPMICAFSFNDLAPNESKTKTYPDKGRASGEIDHRLSSNFPDFLPQVDTLVTSGMRSYNVKDVTQFRLYLVAEYTPGITDAKTQRMVQYYLLKPVRKPADVGTTDVLQQWTLEEVT